MPKRRQTIITMHTIKLAYLMSRKPSKKNKLCVPNVSVMPEEEYLRCMEILNGNKNAM